MGNTHFSVGDFVRFRPPDNPTTGGGEICQVEEAEQQLHRYLYVITAVVTQNCNKTNHNMSSQLKESVVKYDLERVPGTIGAFGDGNLSNGAIGTLEP